MKKFIAAAMLAGFVTVTGASSAMAATKASSAHNDPIARCMRAGGTEKFCSTLGGWQYFVN